MTRATGGTTGWLTRKEAADFLTHQCGCPTTPQQLANMASNNNAGNGPPFTRSGWRTVHYLPDELRAWAVRRVKRVA